MLLAFVLAQTPAHILSWDVTQNVADRFIRRVFRIHRDAGGAISEPTSQQLRRPDDCCELRQPHWPSLSRTQLTA